MKSQGAKWGLITRIEGSNPRISVSAVPRNRASAGRGGALDRHHGKSRLGGFKGLDRHPVLLSIGAVIELGCEFTRANPPPHRFLVDRESLGRFFDGDKGLVGHVHSPMSCLWVGRV